MIFWSRRFFKKRTNRFDFTTCRLVFVRFLEESGDTKNALDNLTYNCCCKTKFFQVAKSYCHIRNSNDLLFDRGLLLFFSRSYVFSWGYVFFRVNRLCCFGVETCRWVLCQEYFHVSIIWLYLIYIFTNLTRHLILILFFW